MNRRKRYTPPSPPATPDKKQDSNPPLSPQVMIACDYIQKAKDEVKQLNAQREAEIEALQKLIAQGRQLLGDGA